MGHQTAHQNMRAVCTLPLQVDRTAAQGLVVVVVDDENPSTDGPKENTAAIVALGDLEPRFIRSHQKTTTGQQTLEPTIDS